MKEKCFADYRRHLTAAIISFVVSVCLLSLCNETLHVFAAPDNSLSVVSVPTAYTITGGYTDIAVSVKNNTAADVLHLAQRLILEQLIFLLPMKIL